MFDAWIPIVKFLAQPFQYLTSAGEKTYWVYLISSFLIALPVFLKINNKRPFSLRAFLAYCFPKEVYGHQSARNDYLFVYLNALLTNIVLIPVMAVLGYSTTFGVQAALSEWGLSGLLGPSPILGSILYTLCMALLIDFIIFYTHYLQHRIPWLWEFHKVHHSAEVLQPLTAHRQHPLDFLSAFTLTTLVAALVDGVFQSVFVGTIGVISFFGLSLFQFLFYFIGSNLRHSHIWLHYGPFWGRVFISPAQHQIHHSVDPKHWDKNMGFIFAWWDSWFGTLYVPQTEEKITFGLNPDGEHKEYFSVKQLFMLPFHKANNFLSRHPKHALAALASVLILISGTAIAVTDIVRSFQDTVFLEDLTWMEVRDKVKSGYTVAIVPTGGTEQNGPHMVLGKHNYVVRNNAEKIARVLGHTLIAPIIAYVPEGTMDPPSEHMRFPGTLSVPEPVFEATLEAAARSLKVHGFKLICFLGDSGGNQAGQAAVAERLSREWRREGVKVLHVSDYYALKEQAVWLMSNGYWPNDIGQHAGIRDTSELMLIHPAGVRKDMLAKNIPDRTPETGADGDSSKASGGLGGMMHKIKLTAAVRQIRQAQKSIPH